MSDGDPGRDPATGRFLPTKSGNPRGRPRKPRTADDAILGAVRQAITVTEDGRRRGGPSLKSRQLRLQTRALRGT
jgi:hypothetical protein